MDKINSRTMKRLMLVFIPVCPVIYQLILDDVRGRISRRKQEN
jgi:hypothetical protein